jgi:fluoride ion exporter CrcB/FEX
MRASLRPESSSFILFYVLANIDPHTVASDAMQALPAGKICALACLSTFAGHSFALPARKEYMPARTSTLHAAVISADETQVSPAGIYATALVL